MKKLWRRVDRFVWGESGMFAGKDYVNTVFPAEQINRVYNLTTGAEYLAGKDYSHVAGSGRLIRLAGSAIPYFSAADLHPAPEKCVFYPAPGHNAIRGGVDGGALLFNNRDFFARNQIEIDYQAVKIDFAPSLAGSQDRLPKFRAKLAAGGKDVKLTFIGDSITYGLNAGKVIASPPYQPCYAELVQEELARIFNLEVVLHNRGVDGSGCRSALAKSEIWRPDRPDLLVIAYGMNDFKQMTPEEYAVTIRQIMRLAREDNPEVEFVLVASMPGNPLWQPTQPEPAAAFAAALRKVVAETADAALADVHGVWREILNRKSFYDLTGNGVNHPNDYGHRIYASTLLTLVAGQEEFL